MSNQKSRKEYIHVTHIPYHNPQRDEKAVIPSAFSDISNLCEFYGKEAHCIEIKCNGKYIDGRFCYTPNQARRSER